MLHYQRCDIWKIMQVVLLTLPALAFMATIIKYGVNIPLYDDITQILWIMNQYIDPALDGTPETVYPIASKLHAIFYPNAGHVPMVTRVFALVQYGFGGVNFYLGVVVACAIWVVTVLFFLRQMNREGFPLYALLPLPCLFFSLVQWEAMHMMLGGLQVYIGTLCLPLLMLYLVTQKKIFLSGIVFFLAIFSSAGALGLVPLAAAYLLWDREWKKMILLLALCVPTVLLFRHLNVFGMHSVNVLEDIPTKIDFMFVFLGNVSAAGSYDLRDMHDIHLYTGWVLTAAGIVGCLLCRGRAFLKMVLVYVLLLAVMTSLKRSGELIHIMSRYSVFALLGAGVVYLLVMGYLLEKSRVAARVWCGAVLLVVLPLWAQSQIQGLTPLIKYRDLRVADMQDYIRTGDASRLMWDPDWCKAVLDKSRRLGVYDYQSAARNP